MGLLVGWGIVKEKTAEGAAMVLGGKDGAVAVVVVVVVVECSKIATVGGDIVVICGTDTGMVELNSGARVGDSDGELVAQGDRVGK